MSGLGRFLVPEAVPGFAVGLYDRMAGASRDAFYARVAEEVAAERDSGLVLDVGTGPGYLPIALAVRLPGVRVIGIDLSGPMVRAAERNAARAGVSDRVSFEVGDANRLRFHDSTCDLVVSTGVFHCWKHPLRALDEIWRVLRPGALALVYDPADLRDGYAILGGPLALRERLAVWWVRLAGRLWPRTWTVESVRELLAQSRFQEWSVSSGRSIRMRLRRTAA